MRTPVSMLHNLSHPAARSKLNLCLDSNTATVLRLLYCTAEQGCGDVLA